MVTGVLGLLGLHAVLHVALLPNPDPEIVTVPFPNMVEAVAQAQEPILHLAICQTVLASYDNFSGD